ncbi:MAG: nucleotide exchange factor GrpE [Clostridia bacterium]|nr:nucleotide exchange factor GrpE [Clostridia bacterium]
MMKENADLAEEMIPEEEAAENTAETAEDTPRKETRAEKKQQKKLESTLAETEKELEKAKEELAASNDRYMRMLAEYDNYRKRTQKEKDTIYADAYSDAMKQILPIIDNLELAARQSADADAAAILGGVEMVLKTAQENLGKLNITAFGEVGDAFDPNRHTAVFHIEDESLGENVIAEVLQKGYEREGRIIRYAVVKVAN